MEEQVTHPINFVRLSEKNLSVFPIETARKKPAIDWKEYQSTIADPFTIEEWSRSTYNIGIATGTVSGVMVLDCDAESVYAWLQANRELPMTPTVRTPRGYHLYFALPDFPVKNVAGLHLRDEAQQLPEGLDVRGQGGFIMAPGSYYIPSAEEAAKGKLEGAYTWVEGRSIDDLAPAAAPDWLLDLLRPRPLPDYTGIAELPITDKWAAAALEGECEKVCNAPRGVGNDTLVRAAYTIGGLVGAGAIDRRDAESALLQAASHRGIDGARATVASGLEGGMKRPRVRLDLKASPKAIPTPTDVLAQIDAEKAQAPAPKPLHGFSAADAPYRDVPEQEWVIEDFVPRGHVTTIFGDGGVGKSLLVQTMGSAIAAGDNFADRDTRQMRVAALMCEDDDGELTRRQQRIIARYYDGDAEAVRGFTLHSRVGEDSTLGFLNPQNVWEKTAFFSELEAFIASEKIEVLILDNIMQMFGGDQNLARPVTLFCNTLTGLAQKMNGAVILLGHIAKADKSTFAGATAWNNAVRSRLFLDRGGDNEADNIRHLSVMKSNYGATGIRATFAIHDGVMVDPLAIDAAEVKASSQKLDKAKAVIISMLKREGSLSLKHQSPAYIRSDDRMTFFIRAGIFDERTIKDAVAEMLANQTLTKRNAIWGSAKSKKERIVLADHHADALARHNERMEGVQP